MIKLIHNIVFDFINSIVLFINYLLGKKKVSLSNNKQNIILLGVPSYTNLGDQAITIAEQKFLEDNFPDANLILIPEKGIERYILFLKKKLKSNDFIMYQGGGNLGSLYPYAERRRRFVVKHLLKNKIIFFPQSIFFENNLSGRYEYFLSKKIYEGNKNLTIMVRENYSLSQMNKLFPSIRTALVPDIVFYLMNKKNNKIELQHPVKKILIVLRNDAESTINKSFKGQLFEHLNQDYSIVKTDTILEDVDKIDSDNRMSFLNDKWGEFRRSDLVITDRLHGLLFAIINNRPCIVFTNNNHKIESTISSWLLDFQGVSFVSSPSIDNVMNSINEFQNMEDFYCKSLSAKFNPLISILKEIG